ncbi:MAG: acyltransferase [Chthonomonas sp.]|nr:acyltransferase [Chthonomonas sp.]
MSGLWHTEAGILAMGQFMERSPTTRTRFAFIEGMRGLAALYVVIGHFGTMADPLGKRADGTWWQAFMAPFAYGHMAVAAFIVISGFCMQMSLYRRDPAGGTCPEPKRFFLARMRRILPPYYACLALSLLVCWLVTSRHTGLPWNQYVPVTGGAIWSHVFLVHNLAPEWMYKINGVLWSIGIEFQLYFTVPVFAWLLARRQAWAVVLVAILASVSIFVWPELIKLYPWYATLFIVGMMAARGAFGPRPGSPLMFGLAALIGLVAGAWWCSLTKSQIGPNLVFGAGVAALLWAGCAARREVWGLAWRPLVGLGVFSYSLYLMHHPVLQVYAHLTRVGSQPLAAEYQGLFAICLPIILATCFGFYWLFERPFMKK